jgi:UDP-glucose 4-epimerase
MKIAVTGGAGFIGSHVTKAYLDAGHDVLVIDSLLYGSRRDIDPRARFYQVDIRDDEFGNILYHERPDIVSHHVSQRRFALLKEHLIADADVHVRGLLNVLESCVNASSVKKFIFASGGNTLYERTANTPLPIAEDSPLKPHNADDISKLTGEWYVHYYTQHYGLKHTILRYADVYGEHTIQREHYLYHPLTYFVYMLSQQHSPVIRGSGEEVRDHIFVDDVAQANVLALRKGENHVLNISSGQGHSLAQLFEMAATLLDSDMRPTYLSGPLEEPAPIVLDNARAQHVLGWKPEVSLTEGMRHIMKYFRPHDEREHDMTTPITQPLAFDETTERLSTV